MVRLSGDTLSSTRGQTAGRPAPLALCCQGGIRRLREMIFATIWNAVFDGRFEDRERALQVFREHTERVKRVVPSDRLLVFEAQQGWGLLCAFWACRFPTGPIPRE